jgi:hypothetical protein
MASARAPNAGGWASRAVVRDTRRIPEEFLAQGRCEMTDRFDPNIPPAGPTDPSIEGEFTGIAAIIERPTLGKSNLVVNREESFDIEVSWHVFGTSSRCG